MKQQLDWKKITFTAVSFALAIAASYYGQPLIHENSNAMNVIVTVFSVLAGFLVAIIALLGDPALLPPGTWRIAEAHRKTLSNRLARHKWMFVLYLITLACIFIALLIPATHYAIRIWVERVFLFFAVFAFILSLRLPGSLMRIQRERIDAVIEHRRQAEGISPDADVK
ncbi:hypothetical protein [Chrysiogenes arsenatis]|uniref:hypothetical protein n=1 Tax=Chrysiogenes arsenatis TaxID=309797 RepID=UPI000428FEB2|nr:hypothetical protein [Chrysiogenes arsenatis]